MNAFPSWATIRAMLAPTTASSPNTRFTTSYSRLPLRLPRFDHLVQSTDSRIKSPGLAQARSLEQNDRLQCSGQRCCFALLLPCGGRELYVLQYGRLVVGILAAVLGLAELLGSWLRDQVGKSGEAMVQSRPVTFLYGVMRPLAYSGGTLGLIVVPRCRIAGISGPL
jgi:hypothetical protein